MWFYEEQIIELIIVSTFKEASGESSLLVTGMLTREN